MESQMTRSVCTASVSGQYRTDPYGAAGTILQKSNPVTVYVLRVKVTKTVTPTCAHPGEHVTYTIVISNESDLPLGQVQVFDSHTAQWFDISNVARNGETLPDALLADGILVGDLPAGGRAVVTFDALARETAPAAPMSAAEVTYEYELQGVRHGGRALSNPAELMMVQPGLSVWKAADRMVVLPDGPPVLYQIKVENTGNVPLSQVKILDLLPPQLEYVPNSLRIDGKLAEKPVSFARGVHLGDLAVEQTAELQFYARVKP